ncbi:MAG: histidinol-phosphatase, partial [Candidatus Krumholzibacteria bacterium]|nr:histidinol-phosphatase [Candidatus Krumholzibacteria bacterium]
MDRCVGRFDVSGRIRKTRWLFVIDYHIHGNFCGHATGELEEYVLVALGKGFKEIGFSAHLPKVKDPDPYHAMPKTDLPRYVELVESLRSRYRGDIAIKLGIEADYFTGYESEIQRLLELFPFDYILGSIHFLGDWHFTSRVGLGRYETEDPDEVFPRYFRLLKRMITSGLFDIVAHPDAIRRADFRPSLSMRDEYLDIAGLILEQKMSIEVNTAG